MGRGVLLHTYITYGERLGATRGLHIHSRDFKPSVRRTRFAVTCYHKRLMPNQPGARAGENV